MLDNLLGGLFGGDKKDSNASDASAGGFDLGNPIVQAVLAAIAAMATGAIRNDAINTMPAMMPSASGAFAVSGTLLVASSTSISLRFLSASICSAGPCTSNTSPTPSRTSRSVVWLNASSSPGR